MCSLFLEKDAFLLKKPTKKRKYDFRIEIYTRMGVPLNGEACL
jgi:hypothetical protein